MPLFLLIRLDGKERKKERKKKRGEGEREKVREDILLFFFFSFCENGKECGLNGMCWTRSKEICNPRR
jgi:hypothetical protein